MTFDEWYKKNADHLKAHPIKAIAEIAWASGQLRGDDAVERAVEQAYSELHTERMALHSALRLVADLRAAIGDDGKRTPPELIEYARGLAAGQKTDVIGQVQP